MPLVLGKVRIHPRTVVARESVGRLVAVVGKPVEEVVRMGGRVQSDVGEVRLLGALMTYGISFVYHQSRLRTIWQLPVNHDP